MYLVRLQGEGISRAKLEWDIETRVRHKNSSTDYVCHVIKLSK